MLLVPKGLQLLSKKRLAILNEAHRSTFRAILQLYEFSEAVVSGIADLLDSTDNRTQDGLIEIMG